MRGQTASPKNLALVEYPPAVIVMTRGQVKSLLGFSLGALFIIAGTMHFTHAGAYVAMMPPHLPYPLQLVYLSGFFEILGGIGLFAARTRRWAGYGLMALLAAVFPANIHMAVHRLPLAGMVVPPLLLWLRLPLQGLLIAAVWWCTRGARRENT